VRFAQHLKSLTDLFAQTPPEKQVGYVAFKSHSVPKVDNGIIICKPFAEILKSFFCLRCTDSAIDSAENAPSTALYVQLRQGNYLAENAPSTALSVQLRQGNYLAENAPSAALSVQLTRGAT
jgi:hypothetical protein